MVDVGQACPCGVCRELCARFLAVTKWPHRVLVGRPSGGSMARPCRPVSSG